MIGRYESHLPEVVTRAVVEGINLAEQGGRQVEGGMDVGIFLEDGDHVHVVFGGVEAHPWRTD
ncbi:MAG: hypothetical protein NTW99_15980 [Chloroflexi bacterium]|nr:hypothetical protein [Chloroflexota bacterium]